MTDMCDEEALRRLRESDLSAAIKYLRWVLRGSKGNEIQDLEKARWYIDCEISRMKDQLSQE